MAKKKNKIGLALGSGSARGMSHIGVIQALKELGIQPVIVAGCSVGAMVGASYATANLDKLEDWAMSMTESKIRHFLKINLNGSGFVNSIKLKELFEHAIGIESLNFDDMELPFGAVATNLSTGKEVWLTEGTVHEALWSSMAFPGLFPSVLHNKQWLVDGGLVNPVPVSLCRALGADVVIAVNLNADIIKSYEVLEEGQEDNEGEPDVEIDELHENPTKAAKQEADASFWDKTKSGFQKALEMINADGSKSKEPKAIDVISNSIHIMSSHLTQSRLVGDPPDVLLEPRLTDVGLLQIYKAEQCIKEGRACVERMKEEIKFRLGIDEPNDNS